MDDLAVADDLERLIGDIDRDVVLAGIVLHPAAAFEIGFDLADALDRRYVHHVERRLRDDAVIGEPMARLEAFDRFDERRIVCFPRSLCFCLQVTGDDKVSPQIGNPSIDQPGLEGRALGNLRPSSLAAISR